MRPRHEPAVTSLLNATAHALPPSGWFQKQAVTFKQGSSDIICRFRLLVIINVGVDEGGGGMKSAQSLADVTQAPPLSVPL